MPPQPGVYHMTVAHGALLHGEKRGPVYPGSVRLSGPTAKAGRRSDADGPCQAGFRISLLPRFERVGLDNRRFESGYFIVGKAGEFREPTFAL